MKRLAPNVRSSLLADAADAFLPASTARWSLRSLADINRDPNTATASDQQGLLSSQAVEPKLQYGLSRARDRPRPRAIVAETLLQDVKVRLAGQHSYCLQLIQSCENPSLVYSDHLPTGTDGTTQPETANKQRAIVRAVNSPIQQSLKIAIEHAKIAQKEQMKALTALQNLETVHADTYALVHHLLDDGKMPTIRRFSQADQNLIAATFEQLRSRHAATVENLADVVIGLRGAKKMVNPSMSDCGIPKSLIDSFLRARLGVQLLCDHYVSLDKGKPHGGIAVNCNLQEVIEDAITEASHLCDANMGTCPEAFLSSYTLPPSSSCSFDTLPPPQYWDGDRSGEIPLKPCVEPVKLTLIRPWMNHVFVELLKNAMESSVKQSLKLNKDGILPPAPIYIHILDQGDDHVFICIVDQGMGISKEAAKFAFRFAESTSLKRWDRIDEQQSYAMVRSPLASLGVGLPLSRMMVQMFGGDLLLMNRTSSSSLSPPKNTDQQGWDSGCTAVVKMIKNDTFPERREIEYSEDADCYWNHDYDVSVPPS